MELNGEVQAFSELIGRPVYDQAGRKLGRVFEARAHWEGDGSIVLDELLVGGWALWLRLRGPRRDAHGIPWQAVTEVSEERILVRDPGTSR
jgi:sporulation protein YlmC with PRC-barrel domain